VRRVVLISLLALAMAASASAAAQESPYQARPTRWCLISHGASAHRLTKATEQSLRDKFGYGQPYDAIRWNFGGLAGLGIPYDSIGIEFTPSPARGLASERRVSHILRADYGFGAQWIHRHLMRRANVVIAAYSTNRPLTASQRAVIVGCLRPK
jgi:hypothetical protein